MLSTQSPRGEELEEVSEETGQMGGVAKETGVHAAPPEHSVAELVGIYIRTHARKASVVLHPVRVSGVRRFTINGLDWQKGETTGTRNYDSRTFHDAVQNA